MTREEQIQKLIDEETGIDNYGSSDYQIGVCDGVRFADKTMLERAKEYLENNIDKDLIIYYNITWKKRDEFIKDFIRAMKESDWNSYE